MRTKTAPRRPADYIRLRDQVTESYRRTGSVRRTGEEFGRGMRTILRWLRWSGEPINPPSSHRVYDLDESAFDRMTPDAAYWAGFIITDGCVSQRSENGFHIKVAIQERDVGHLLKLKQFLRSNAPVLVIPAPPHRPGRPKAGPQVRFGFNSPRIARSLIAHGITPRKTLVCRASDELAASPDFWRGAIDGDGSLFWTRPCKAYPDLRYPGVDFCGSRLMCEQLAAFVAGQGIPAPEVKRRRAGEELHFVRLNSQNARSLIEVLYRPDCVALDRKTALAAEMLAAPPIWQRPDTSHVTAADLTAMHERLGTWTAVARELGIKADSIQAVRRRRGML